MGSRTKEIADNARLICSASMVESDRFVCHVMGCAFANTNTSDRLARNVRGLQFARMEM